MKTILLTNHYTGQPQQIVSQCVPDSFQLVMLDEVTQEDLIRKIPDADYLLCSGRIRIGQEELDAANHLSMIQRTGVGLDSLDLKLLRERNIPLYVNQGVNADSVAEHTILLMLGCLRRLPVIQRNLRNGIWKKQEQGIQTYELSNKRVGLIGMGNISRRVARILNAFGAEIWYYDVRRLSPDEEAELELQYCSLPELFAHSDILSLHCPLNAQTMHIVNAETIGTMREGAVIVNTARGGLIDTRALCDALRSGRIAFAGLDVYETEPLNDPELRALEQVILTPHIGGVTYDSFARMMRLAMHNIQMYDRGELAAISHCLYTM